jgi:hypothetical protein
MSLRSVNLEDDLVKMLDVVDFENTRSSPDADLSKRLRATLIKWKEDWRSGGDKD